MPNIPKILIVDDEPRMCESLKLLLSGQNYELETSNSAKKAIEYLERDTFDLVLLDLILPDMSGHQIIDHIKNHSPDTLIIVITGQALMEPAIGSLKQTVYDYFKKPFEPDNLVTTVKNALDQKRLIAEQKIGAEMLRESAFKFRTFFDLSPQAVAVYHFETETIFDINQKFIALFKFSKEEVLGKSLTELGFYSQEKGQQFRKIFQKSGEVHGLEMDLRAKDGSIVKTLVYARPVQIKSRMYIFSIFNDISEQKKLEVQLRQSRKMEALGTLAGSIAHDFNNLLMGMRTSLMLMDTESCNPYREHLTDIEDYVNSATDLARQLLDFARTGKNKVRPAKLNDIIRKSADLFDRTKKEISVHQKYQANIWPVEVNQVQINQVLLNLYINAWQSMPGGGDLYLETKNVILDDDVLKPYALKPGKYVKISVVDTGTGMDKDTQKRIFDPFFTTKETNSGTGMGLTSAYGIIKDHGGFINVYSKKNEGSAFNIYLPVSGKQFVKEKLLAKNRIKDDEIILLVDEKEKNDKIERVAKTAPAKAGDPQAVETLIRLLDDQDDKVRKEAAGALGKIGDPRAVEPLIKLVKFKKYDGKIEKELDLDLDVKDLDFHFGSEFQDENQDVGVRRIAAEALGVIGDSRAVAPLISALDDPDDDVRKKAVGALGKIGDIRATEPLIWVLDDNDGDLRREAASALGKIGDARAAEPLIRLLDDQDEQVRKQAAGALGKIGDPRTVELLIKRIKITLDTHNELFEEELSLDLDVEKLDLNFEPENKAEDRAKIVQLASKSIAQIGAPAIAPLMQALKDTDLEIKIFAKTTLNQIKGR